MIKEGAKLHLKSFAKGAKPDYSEHLLGSKEDAYYDALNMRPTNNSAIGRIEKIGGDIQIYDYSLDNIFQSVHGSPVPDINSYHCIGAIGSTTHIVGFFASDNPSVDGSNLNYPLVTVDDKVMVYSDKLLKVFFYDKPLHVAVDDLLVDGIVLTTNEYMVPMFWELKDIIERYNANDGTYFEHFNINEYIPNFNTYLDYPKFVQLEELSVPSGLKWGLYSYSIRYVTNAGDRTQFSASTPLIPVMSNYTHITPVNENGWGIYPSAGTWSEDVVTDSYTKYGIKIRFRVTNINNYSYIELKRIKFTGNAPLDEVPSAEVYKIPTILTDGLIDVWEFTDQKNIEWLPLSNEQNNTFYGEVMSAKDGAFYNNRAALYNIEYFERTLNLDFLKTKNNNAWFPIIKDIGIEGHTKPDNYINYKSYKRGERYPFYLIGYDSQFQWSFAIPIENTTDISHPNLNNYQFPQRRDLIEGDSFDYINANLATDGQIPLAVTKDNTLNEIDEIGLPVYEVFNIPANEDGRGFYVHDGKGKGNTAQNVVYDGNTRLHPMRLLDSETFDVPINSAVYDNPDSPNPYNPKIFDPHYHSLGLAITGVSNLPDWVSGIQVVRGKPAERVVSQGLVTYGFNNYDGGRSNTHTDPSWEKVMSKYEKVVYYFSDDLIANIGTEPVVGNTLELVSPLGFVSETYNGGTQLGVTGNSVYSDMGTDLMLYARLFFTNSSPNNTTTPNLDNIDGTYTNGTYWTKFGQWRGEDRTTVARKYTITSVNKIAWGEHGRQWMWQMIIDSQDGGASIYDNSIELNDGNTNSDDAKKFHEPFYIANIISEGANISISNVSNFMDTNSIIKIKSVIGVYNIGSLGKYEVVNERDYDYKPISDTAFSFIHVDGKAFVNIDRLSGATITAINTDISFNGFYVADRVTGFPSPYNPTAGDVNCYGTYTTQEVAGKRYVTISYAYLAGITEGSFIEIRYDDRIPIEVFGGDTIISESTHTLVDGLQKQHCYWDLDNNYNIEMRWDGFGGLYSANKIPMPYSDFNYSDVYLPRFSGLSTPPPIIGNSAYGQNGFAYINDSIVNQYHIRQLCVMFASENKIDVDYAFSILLPNSNITQNNPSIYPKINYIMRPCRWNDEFLSSNFSSVLHGTLDSTSFSLCLDWDGAEGSLANYHTASGGANPYKSGWAYGGFRTNPGTKLDYSKQKNDKVYTNQPIVGFTTKYKFPTRIIWSNKKQINLQDSPNLKTFLATSYYDADEIYGEGKDLFVANGAKGENIYGFNEHGIVMFITNKTQLTDANSNVIGYMPVGNNLVQGEIWESKEIGMDAENWVTAAAFNEQLFFTNKKSCYLFDNGKIINLGEMGWLSVIRNIEPSLNNQVSSMYDANHDEYWINIHSTPTEVLLPENKTGHFDYTGIYLTQININNPEHSSTIYRIPINIGEYIDIKTSATVTEEYLSVGLSELVGFETGDEFIVKNSLATAGLTFNLTADTLFSILNDGLSYVFRKEEIGFSAHEATYDELNYTISFSIKNIEEIKHADYIGKYGYNADRYCRKLGDKETYGFKGIKLYKYGYGNIIHNNNQSQIISSSLIFPVSILQNEPITKEWVNIAINTHPHISKPTKIEFADNLYDILNNPQAELSITSPESTNPFYLKDYGNWSNFIPRHKESPYNRFQNDVIWVKVVSENYADNFAINNILIGEKPIKII